MTAPAGARCGNRLPIEHATLVCGRKAGHDGEHRCTRADGSETGWADIPTPMTAAVPDPFRDQLAEAAYEADANDVPWAEAWTLNRQRYEHIADALLPLVEARVQAAANQRAAEVLEAAVREDSISTHRLTPIEALTLRVVRVDHLWNRAAALAQPGVEANAVHTGGQS